MAAGLGFKDFQTGEVLTAADVDGYLMQGIWVFASTAARDAAVTSPSEGNFAFTKDTNSLWYYDGAAWVASGATGDIEGVTAGIGISGGGTSGTVTVTNSMATAIDAKGDLVAGTGADTFAKLTVGANNTVLTADSAEATGLKWATPASGGGMTSIASGSLSGGTLSLTSISGSYKNLQLVLRDYQHSGDTALGFTVNSVTSYEYTGIDATNNYAQVIYSMGSDIELTRYNAKSGDDNNALIITLNDYANTTANKQVDSLNTYKNDRATNPDAITKIWGVAVTTSAITSITITAKSNNFNGGTYILYGVS